MNFRAVLTGVKVVNAGEREKWRALAIKSARGFALLNRGVDCCVLAPYVGGLYELGD